MIDVKHAEHYESNFSDNSSDQSVLNINSKNSHGDIPSVHVKVFKTDVKLLIDTGATVNIVNKSMYEKLDQKPALKQPVSLIFAYGSTTPLPCTGYFIGKISYKGISVNTEMYVI